MYDNNTQLMTGLREETPFLNEKTMLYILIILFIQQQITGLNENALRI